MDQPTFDTWIVADILLQKLHVLPGSGPFQLEYDELGHSCIVQDQFDCKKSVGCDDIVGELFVKHTSFGDTDLILQSFDKAKNLVHTNISESQCKYKELKLTLCIRHSSAVDKLTGYIFAIPRHGQQRVFWGLGQLYKCFQMSCYKGKPSGWVQRLKKSYSGIWQKLGLGSQVFFWFCLGVCVCVCVCLCVSCLWCAYVQVL